ncbi:DUF2516 family protein [Nocardioides sp. SYSU DS0663]|uniref:DUF2516 family protein n=1 Tax=Nocardioides sp. SYSU DS0663 TaxID=3416445 RepID=UPI003F4B100E
MDNFGVFANSVLVLAIIFVVVTLLALALWLWALVDALRFTEQEWEAAGQSRNLWLVLLVGALLAGIPFVAALVYLFWPRPALKRARQG